MNVPTNFYEWIRELPNELSEFIARALDGAPSLTHFGTPAEGKGVAIFVVPMQLKDKISALIDEECGDPDEVIEYTVDPK